MDEIAAAVARGIENPGKKTSEITLHMGVPSSYEWKKLLIFDEPTSGLDFRHMCQMEKLMKRLAEEKYIIIVVIHDYEFLNRACKRYIRINS